MNPNNIALNHWNNKFNRSNKKIKSKWMSKMPKKTKDSLIRFLISIKKKRTLTKILKIEIS